VRDIIRIDQALRDPHLLQPALGNPATWFMWIALLKVAFACPLTPAELELVAYVIGARKLPGRRVRELWCVVGRRGGKSRVAAALAVYLALLSPHPKLAKGETGMVLVLAKSVDQAQTVFKYALAFLTESPALADEIESTTRDEIRLRNGVVIAIHPASFKTVRGRTLLGVIFDELAFWPTEDSAEPDREIYRAVLPALATTRGMLIAISSPYRKVGLLFEKHRDHYGQDGDDVLVAQGATSDLNPTLSAAEIERQQRLDPGGHASEWLAEFRSDLSAFLDEASIEQCIDYSRPLELPPRSGVFYRAFVDAAGGTGGDSYTISVAHKEKDNRIIVDLVRGTKGRFNPVEVTEAYASLLREYRVRSVKGDRYGAEWVKSAWSKAGVRYVASELPKSEIYLECQPVFVRGLASLPNHAVLLRDVRLVEYTAHRSGKGTVDHPRGGHDDHINAAAGAIDAVARGFGLDYSAWADRRETDPDVLRMAQAVEGNEREWGKYKRGGGTPKDVLEMIERADAERAAATATAAMPPAQTLEAAIKEFSAGVVPEHANTPPPQ
jgi:hypothetical protein